MPVTKRHPSAPGSVPRVHAVALLALVFVHGASAQEAEGLSAFGRGDYAAAERALDGVEGARAEAFLALTKAATARCEEAEPGLRVRYGDARLRRLTGLALARCLIAAERWPEAAQLLAALAKELPGDADVLYENARLHLKAWNGAVERMFEQAPASFRVNQLSAEIFEIQGRYGEAVAEYRKAIRKSPRTLNLRYRLGRALLLRSHDPEALDEALGAFEAELALNAYDAVAEYQIAQILEVQQQPEKAAGRLERAVELDPKFAEALTALARYRSRAEEHAAAAKLLERAVEIQPESESAWYALMVAYRNAGRRDDALRAKGKLEVLQESPEGEFTDFLRRIGEQPQP